MSAQDNQQHTAQMHEQMGSGKGFIAALDQSGGSTPGALAHYGIAADAYSTDAQMFDLVHEMRTRVMTSPSFNGTKILAAILFEDTMDRQVDGRPTCDYLWHVKQVVPILKVDKGLADQANGVRMMKPIPGLDQLLQRAVGNGVFGTKMRSVIELADTAGVQAIVDQQFDLAHQILDAGLVPIIEPEVDIHSPEKAEAEGKLRDAIAAHLDGLQSGQQVMLKLSLPSVDGFYSDFIADPRVLRVVALSGGYSQEEADELLARNPGLIASFSRALLEGLTAQQSDEQFDATLSASIDKIYRASIT